MPALPCSLVAYAAAAGGLAHLEALAHARAAGLAVCKHDDPLDAPRRDISDADALEVAREDVSLVYVDRPRVAVYAEHCTRSGRPVCWTTLLDTPDSDDYVWLSRAMAGEWSEHPSSEWHRRAGRTALDLFLVGGAE